MTDVWQEQPAKSACVLGGALWPRRVSFEDGKIHGKIHGKPMKTFIDSGCPHDSRKNLVKLSSKLAQILEKSSWILSG